MMKQEENLVDRHSFKKLEFHRIKEILESYCQTPLGIVHVSSLEPLTDLDEIQKKQAETSEAVIVLRHQPMLSLENIRDLTPLLKRAVVGGVLTPDELLIIKDNLATTEKIREEFMQIKKDLPYLRLRAESLNDCKPLQEKINQCILPDGEISDNASSELARLRQQMRKLEEKVRNKIEEILTKAEWNKYLQEPIYTVRGDRYVVPVKQEYRNQFPGLIHDQSGSGATVFMEPLPLVNLMNELASVRAAICKVEARILEELTRLVAVYDDEIQNNLKLLGELDFIMAKGRYSIKLKAIAPRFREPGYLEIKRARHPLLKGEVVPLDLELGKDFDCLIITGPNTGGKTVALKTVGLLVLMAQAGLHVPVFENSIFCVFQSVFADIGDEQSIEQSLSTFSGHMTNIVRILQCAQKGSLVLLDELGAGTDPEQGAALSMAILEHLMHKEVLTIATTHYSELKVFAHSRPRAENACVEFNSVTLRPTFKLSIGMPGESNAFEIASRLGLFPEVIERARNFLKPENRELSDLIQHLKEDQAAASVARSNAEQLRSEIEQLRDKIKHEKEEIRKKEREILTKALFEAQEIVRAAKAEAEKLISSLKEEQKEMNLREMLRKTEIVRNKLCHLSENVVDKIESISFMPHDENVSYTDIKAGDSVIIPRFNQEGYVLTEPNNSGDVLVQVGALKLNLPVTELRLCRKAKNIPVNKRTQTNSIEDKAAVAPQLDFRGLRVEDALEEIDKYLDRAYLAGLRKVSLIHGKGTGVLRNAVRKYLAEHPFVASYRFGGYYEGGIGVTVVEFK